MDSLKINRALSMGEISAPGILPRLEDLERSSFIFRIDFGLGTLPTEPGLILVRGPRQYGKSTWLQHQIRDTVLEFGPGSAYFLNGDEIRDTAILTGAIRDLLPLYNPDVTVKRLFIDEITAINGWERGLKLLIDGGELRDVLVVTTGSKATDLRRGSERLPGRRGKLARTVYLFTPVSYAEFTRVCGDKLEAKCLPSYILSGGSPIACAELASQGRIPEYVIELTRDWIYGEIAASGRDRSSLLGVMECLHRFAGSPLGQAKLAREAGLANNTIAAGYINILMDLMCVATAHAWDESMKRRKRRRPAKFHMVNLLAAIAWHPRRIRTTEDLLGLPESEQGVLIEWVVAQEFWRRAASRGDEMPELMHFWQGGGHEIDFVVDDEFFVEVKRGRVTPVEFSWFPKTFPARDLTVIGQSKFKARHMRSVTLEEFLLEPKG